MRKVKLLRIVEELVPCERDFIPIRHMNNEWTRLPDTDEVINSKITYKETIIPITHFCQKTKYPMKGYTAERNLETGEFIYSKDIYVAIDYENSEYLKCWIDNQNKELSNQIEKLQSVNLKWIGKYNEVKELVRDATFWQRFKWLFTGVKVD